MAWYGTVMTWMIIVLGTLNLVRMAFFMVGSDLYALKMAQMRKRVGWFPLPSFTVIIPAHNEERTIRSSLLSVIHAQYEPTKLQIIVADDGSRDSTAAIVKEVMSEFPDTDIALISRPNSGKAHALNYVMRFVARGELLMCLDADSSLEPKALVNAARYFTDAKVVALSANVKIRQTGSLFNLIQAFEYLVCYQMKRAHTFFNVEYIIGGIGSTFRRSALEEVGYYDTNTITEDIDLTMKLLRLGNKKNRVIYGSDVITYTESVLTMTDLIKQRFRWKWGRGQTFQKNWSMFFTFQRKHGKFLTWFYLPYALFSDFAFFLEPLVVSYLAYVVIRYADPASILSAVVVVATYLCLILSVAEYVALIKTYWNYGRLKKSISENICGWEHVARARA
jgi:biofilm PGA synthesis N-glycosyltransferase PgaC